MMLRHQTLVEILCSTSPLQTIAILFSNYKGEHYTHIHEGDANSPHVYIKSDTVLNEPEVEKGVYKVLIPNKLIKDYNKLLNGSWSTISEEMAYKIIEYLPQPSKWYAFNGITKTVEGFYNLVRSTSKKYDSETSLVFARVLMSTKPNMEIIPPLKRILYVSHKNNK